MHACVVCGVKAAYGYVIDMIPSYCAMHKPASAVNFRGKLCVTLGCIKKPRYSVGPNSKPLYCCMHKPVGAIINTN